MNLLTIYLRSADGQHEIGQDGIQDRGYRDLACTCGDRAGLRRVRTDQAAKDLAHEHLRLVGAEPEQNRGGRPAIGTEVKTRLDEATLAAIDGLAEVRGSNRAAVLRESAERTVSHSTVYLYETDLGVYIQRGDGWVWGGADADAGAPAGSTFSQDAAAWIAGDWEPATDDGWEPVARVCEWEPVAWWTPWAGIVRGEQTIGANAREYITV